MSNAKYQSHLRLATTALIAMMFAQNAWSAVVANVEVTNPSAFARDNEVVTISFTQLGFNPADPPAMNLSVLDNKVTLSTEQIDTDGDGKLDALMFVSSFKANEKHQFSVVNAPDLKAPSTKKQTQAEISIKQGGQWEGNAYQGGKFVNVSHVMLPPQYTAHSNYIRYEGPGIESDKVAYRVYLDDRNGFDIFGKKIPDMVLQSIGHDDQESYEYDAPWGLDIFKVGNSLGTGGFGSWNGRQVEPIAVTEHREAVITANGNLYSSFNIHYDHWKVNDHVYDMNAMISMNANSRLAYNMVHINAIDSNSTIPPMAIGVVHHPNTKLLQSDPSSKLEWAYSASWGKQSRIAPDEYLGIGVIFHRTQRTKQTEDETSYVSVMDVSKGVLDYYFFAAWDKEPGGIKTEAEFKAFLDREVEQLSSPLRVEVFKPHNMKIH